ncbi:hypothetical protein ASPFODRAFT_100351, partial [Aspergillus luchuensis CBS 106.47]
LTIHWIPAHIGVEGNEVADSEAKRAAECGAGPGQQIIWLASAAKRAVRSKFQDRWAKQWKVGHTAAPTRRL